MDTGLILTIDTGSSSMKGALFTAQGHEVARSVQSYWMHSGNALCVEMEAQVFRDALTAILRDLVAAASSRQGAIRAIALTSQRSSVLALDAGGAPLRPILMWHDKRSVAICESLGDAENTLYDICGMRASPVFSAPKMRWIKDNEPEIYEKAAKLIGIHDYLLFLLTGEFATDESLASRTNLLDLRSKEWSDELLGLFAIDREKLCDIKPVGEVVGHSKGRVAVAVGLDGSIPVISAGGDQQCAALGLCVLRPGDVSVNTGSGAFITAAVDAPVFDRHKRVLCNVASVPDQWVVEGGILAAGLTWQWFCETFYDGDFALAEKEAAFSAPGARGVIMLPCLGGKGAPDWDPHARGAFHGMSFAVQKGDLARACLEGIAAELCDCFDAVRDAAQLPDPDTVNYAGGLGKSPLFNQILSDSLNASLRCFSGEESTLRGAWMVATVALGMFPGFADAFAAATSGETVRFFNPDKERHAEYMHNNQLRRSLYTCAREQQRILENAR